MFRLLVISLMSACFATGQTLNFTNFGVGFNLALDHGLASVYFEDGTTVDIAKIEGSHVYKAAMRAEDSMRRDDNRYGQINTKQSFLGRRIRLPCWLGGECDNDKIRVHGLSLMLKVLKTATESYLDSQISTAEIAVPFPASEAYFHDLRRASAALSLRQFTSGSLTGVAAARAQGLSGECHDPFSDPGARDDPERLILTIDYSRAALTALLFDEECGLYWRLRVIHNTELGVDALHQLHGSMATDPLETALRNITRLPLEDRSSVGIKHISNLVIIGESASDARLHDVLRRVLSEPFTAFVAGNSGLSRRFDPLFAASNGAAHSCWSRLNAPVDPFL